MHAVGLLHPRFCIPDEKIIFSERRRRHAGVIDADVEVHGPVSDVRSEEVRIQVAEGCFETRIAPQQRMGAVEEEHISH